MLYVKRNLDRTVEGCQIGYEVKYTIDDEFMFADLKEENNKEGK